MQNTTLLEITCHGSISVQRIMDYVQRLQSANLQLELGVIWYNWTWHWTWDRTEPSPWVRLLFWFIRQRFFLMAWLTSSKVEEIMILANCRPRGVTLIFSYIRRLCFFLFCFFFFGGGGVKIWILISFGVFSKMNIFWVLRFCAYFFFFFFFWGGGGHHNIGLYLGGHFYAF